MMNHNFLRISLLLVALNLLTGCFSRNGPPAEVEYDKPATPYHRVKTGESIKSIAAQYGMSSRELVKTNDLKSPYKITPGQRLMVKPHATKNSDEEGDNPEAAGTEEVGSVPEEGGVSVNPIAPVAGVATAAASQLGSVESQGHHNQEVDDEAQADGEEQKDPKHKYDEDNLDAAEQKDKSHLADETSAPSSAPSTKWKFAWPTKGKITRPFNPKGKGGLQNDGINIGAARGTPIVAASDGTVAHAGNQLRGFGNVVLVKHDNGMMTVYAHMDKVAVNKGEAVSAGQKLGTVGQTGTVKEPQLHFEIRQGRKPVDPGDYLDLSSSDSLKVSPPKAKVATSR